MAGVPVRIEVMWKQRRNALEGASIDAPESLRLAFYGCEYRRAPALSHGCPAGLLKHLTTVTSERRGRGGP